MKKLLIIIGLQFLLSCQAGIKNNSDSELNSQVPRPITIEKSFSIQGMHCDMCVASIEKGVKKLEGIEFVSARLSDSSAVVRFDESSVNSADIQEAIEKRGYHVTEVSGD